MVGDRGRGAEDDRVGAVGQHDERDRLVGPGRLERATQHQRRVRGTRVADGRVEPGDDALGRDTELLRHRTGRALMRARHDEVVDLVGDETGVLQRGLPRLDPQARVPRLAEAFLPHLRTHVAGRAPPVEELLGGRLPGHELGEHRPVGIVPHEQGSRAVAARRFVGTTRQAVTGVRADDQARTNAPERGAERTEPGTHRTHDVVRRGVAAEPERGVHGRRVGLVEIGGRDRGEPDRTHLGVGCAADGAPGGFDTHRRRVLVVGRDGARPLATPTTRDRGDRRAIEAPVRQVGTPTQ